MKKINDGSVYNTETSKKLGKWEGNKITETLYITKAGKYFLYCEDGTRLKLHFSFETDKRDSSYLRGIDIIPLTFEQVTIWAKEKLSEVEYFSVFEHRSDLDNKVTLNITISSECKSVLERARSKTGKSISQIVSELVYQHIDDVDKI